MVLDLEMVKKFLRVNYDEDDWIISTYINAAMEYAQKNTGIKEDILASPVLKSAILRHISLLYNENHSLIEINALNSIYSMYRAPSLR